MEEKTGKDTSINLQWINQYPLLYKSLFHICFVWEKGFSKLEWGQSSDEPLTRLFKETWIRIVYMFPRFVYFKQFSVYIQTPINESRQVDLYSSAPFQNYRFFRQSPFLVKKFGQLKKSSFLFIEKGIPFLLSLISFFTQKSWLQGYNVALVKYISLNATSRGYWKGHTRTNIPMKHLNLSFM